jgi:hypothetical protein
MLSEAERRLFQRPDFEVHPPAPFAAFERVEMILGLFAVGML